MKKTISFSKELEFPTMIGEIVEISLDDNLKFIDSCNVKGSFFINGAYKMTEASRLKEGFSFNVPVEIALTQDLEIDTCEISISDFTYEIVNENILKCNIDVLVEGVEAIDISEEVEELNAENKDRECDGDKEENKEIEIPVKDRNIETLEAEELDIKEEIEIPEKYNIESKDIPKLKENNTEEKITNSLFLNLTDEDDSFSTYSIYIVREDDSLEKIVEKYKVTKEQIEEYNDLSNISLNSKIIIPSVSDEKN